MVPARQLGHRSAEIRHPDAHVIERPLIIQCHKALLRRNTHGAANGYPARSAVGHGNRDGRLRQLGRIGKQPGRGGLRIAWRVLNR